MVKTVILKRDGIINSESHRTKQSDLWELLQINNESPQSTK